MKHPGAAWGDRYAMVAPHAGAWIETATGHRHALPSKSPPMRGRGLKRNIKVRKADDAGSPPMRGRGLKLL